jgi:transcriptional regulator with XRE-family HTH domain
VSGASICAWPHRDPGRANRGRLGRLETDFSKGHLSNILRGNGNPTVTTLARLAKSLDVDVRDFFVFPERHQKDRAMDLLDAAKPETLRRVLRILAEEAGDR